MTATLPHTAEKKITNSYAEAIASKTTAYLLDHYSMNYHCVKQTNETRRTGQRYICRTVVQFLEGVRLSGQNEQLLKDGTWGTSSSKVTHMLFDSEEAAQAHIATLPAPRLHKRFEIGDRVRTIRPEMYGERNNPQKAILTGTVTRVLTGEGFGFQRVVWDVGDSYWCPTEPYADFLEFLPADHAINKPSVRISNPTLRDIRDYLNVASEEQLECNLSYYDKANDEYHQVVAMDTSDGGSYAGTSTIFVEG